MIYSSLDTIAAIATPTGLGGISIIRISGNNALSILERLFQSPQEDFTFRPRFMHYGHIILPAEKTPIDEVLAVYMPNPHSATGEDVAEIHCHGGIGVTSCILDAVLANGARLAAPGEFTKRAFLAGRIDLTQAEAIAEIISAPTKQGVRLANAKMTGILGEKISSLRKKLDALRMQITLAVDFPEEDAELLPRDAFAVTVKEALFEVTTLLHAFNRSKLWREGATVTLVGAVNAGKSSLFNGLLGRHRAIVSPIPGTTRDYIEETINLDGLAVRLIDTAGLRTSDDVIEQEGITLSHNLAKNTDCLVLVVDASKEHLEDEALHFLSAVTEVLSQNKIIVVLNKQDSLRASELFDQWQNTFCAFQTLPASAATGTGVDELALCIKQVLLEKTSQTFGGGQEAVWDIAPNLRQSQLLVKAAEELRMLQSALDDNLPADVLGVNLDYVVQLLHEVTGTTDNEELLNQIFATFCIGK